MTRWYRYCQYPLLCRALALGWNIAADLGDRHGEWACLVVWPFEEDHEPPWPTRRGDPARQQ